MMDMIKRESDTLESLLLSPKNIMEAACPKPSDFNEIKFAREIEMTAKAALNASQVRPSNFHHHESKKTLM